MPKRYIRRPDGTLIEDNGAAVDSSLAIAGAAADAKAVGDKLSEVYETIGDLDVQADWNQNDETASDYVKHRLAWADDPVETVLLEETELTFIDGGAKLPTTIQLEEGQTYIVTCNSVDYECVAWFHGGINTIFVGNGVYADSPEMGNGEPFLTNGEAIMGEGESATIKILTIEREVHPLDPKYMPTVPHIDPELTSHVKYSVNLESLFGIPVGDVLDSEKGESMEHTLSKKRWDMFSNYVCNGYSEIKNSPMVMWNTFICEDIRPNLVSGYRMGYSTKENAPCIILQSFFINIDYNPETEILTCTKTHFVVGYVSANEE